MVVRRVGPLGYTAKEKLLKKREFSDTGPQIFLSCGAGSWIVMK
jgi:hypothetical protein